MKASSLLLGFCHGSRRAHVLHAFCFEERGHTTCLYSGAVLCGQYTIMLRHVFLCAHALLVGPTINASDFYARHARTRPHGSLRPLLSRLAWVTE